MKEKRKKGRREEGEPRKEEMRREGERGKGEREKSEVGGREKYIYKYIYLVSGVRQGSTNYGRLVWGHI